MAILLQMTAFVAIVYPDLFLALRQACIFSAMSLSRRSQSRLQARSLLSALVWTARRSSAYRRFAREAIRDFEDDMGNWMARLHRSSLGLGSTGKGES
jgi:hypothetical protein